MYSSTYASNRIESATLATDVASTRTLKLSSHDLTIGTTSRHYHVLQLMDKVILLPYFELCYVDLICLWDFGPGYPPLSNCDRVSVKKISKTRYPHYGTHRVDYKNLLFVHTRRDNGKYELRRCIINLGERAYSSPHLNCFYPGACRSDLRPINEFLKRPLKVLTFGDPVFVLPAFTTAYVVGFLQPSEEHPERKVVLSPITLQKPLTQVIEWYSVPLDQVLFLQTYWREWREEPVWKVLLAVDFRGVKDGF